MCFKRKPPPVVIDSSRKALLFAINDYPGSANDLNGCLNDQKDVASLLVGLGFETKLFSDKEATKWAFISNVSRAISNLRSGDCLVIHYSGHGTQEYDPHGDETDGYDEAICMYDGNVIDDDIGACLMNIPDGATVFLMFDSCFSGTATRGFGLTKNRYMVTLPKRGMKNVRFPEEDMKWIIFSGCGESQTSADAYIDGKYCGAFTYFALKTLSLQMTYREWMTAIRTHLPGNGFNQAPTLEGKSELKDKVVFNFNFTPKMKSKLFSVNLEDFGKGLLLAVLTALIFGLNELFQSGPFLFDWATFQPIVMAAVAAGLSYILKQFMTNSQGVLLKKELKK